MPVFSDFSKTKLADAHPLLQDLMEEVIKHFDIMILETFRSPQDQLVAYRTGKSQLKPGESKHNSYPARAIDVAPWRPEKPHIDWNDLEKFRFMGGFILGISSQMDIQIRWGGDWDGDFNFRDQTLVDMPHFELIES